MVDLVLASSSPYRRALLERLGIPFVVASPDIDESPLPEEAPQTLVARLAAAKASAVDRSGVIIGSDQVAVVGNTILGKPGSRDRALDQLSELSGNEVRFLTSVCVKGPDSPPIVEVDVTTVSFRDLQPAAIAAYVDKERPFDCAGSFKSEGLGITLFDRIDSDDPTALIGLPLIRLCRLLRGVGVDPLA